MQNYILYIKNIINLYFNKTYYYKYIRYKRNIPFILMLQASEKKYLPETNLNARYLMIIFTFI